MEKITFYQCCHSQGDPLTVGDYCFLEGVGDTYGEPEQSVGERRGFLFERLHVSADKCDSCLPSLSLYFNAYFAPTDALPCFRTFSNLTEEDRIPIPSGF